MIFLIPPPKNLRLKMTTTQETRLEAEVRNSGLRGRHLQRFQVRAVDVLSDAVLEESEHYIDEVHSRLGVLVEREDGEKEHLTIFNYWEGRNHEVNVQVGFVGQPDSYTDHTFSDREYLRFVSSALYRIDVKRKLSFIQGTSSSRSIERDAHVLDSSVQTLTMLLAPVQNLPTGATTMDIDTRKDVFINVYRQCVKEIGQAFEHLKEQFQHLHKEGVLPESTFEKVHSNIQHYQLAYELAQRHAGLLR